MSTAIFTLDSGAHLEGQVKASVVVVGGELLGNIDNAKRVELLETGVINGDVKAGSLYGIRWFAHARSGGVWLGRRKP